ncbi:hypothetical protein KY290_033596 [Solanum tuberosum]|uniref:Uncharacterized protein n=1 Tax=Solanum tuberosum TaxID=4113 RepID=A0ABQ7U2K1_SOLTU|nr:hypothetical protein KY289_032966 [Solanum tuberosum]KAH0644666.1 hypothetical protein KY284_032550 [Solanum tuberosum]KAH0647608.1 hypothetical protein KY285_032856 [Solanum tuberosum]KAH0740553.1 hypothetical protein KY290_033596 [Solanum tuberosum]
MSRGEMMNIEEERWWKQQTRTKPKQHKVPRTTIKNSSGSTKNARRPMTDTKEKEL